MTSRRVMSHLRRALSAPTLAWVLAGLSFPAAAQSAAPDSAPNTQQPSSPIPGASSGKEAMDGGMESMPKMGESGPGKSQAPPVGSLPQSDGAAPGHYAVYGVTLEMPDDPLLSKVQLDNLEIAHSGSGGDSQRWDGRFWVGRNLNKLWIRSEGIRHQGRVEEGDAEALWGHAISPFWDLMVGVRHDLGSGPERNWLALGIQGLAPYAFEFEATFYVGPSGRSAFRLKTSQDWLFTQRLVFTPELEANAFGRSDPARGVGSGLSDAALSLRLRYEFSRKFAPYLGYSWARALGGTAGMTRASGRPVVDRTILLGARIWF